MKNSYFFLILCFLTFFLGEVAKYVLDTNALVYNNLAERLTIEQTEQTFEQIRKWQIWGYLLIPVLLFVKTHLIASILGIGSFILNVEVPYKKLWRIVLQAEFLFLIPGILKIVWFYFFETFYTLEDVQNFYPLSLLNLIGSENVAPWFLYPLQTLNVFEAIYWLLLAYLLDKALKTPKNQHTGIKIVASSYGPGLLIWVGAIMFLVLNIG